MSAIDGSLLGGRMWRAMGVTGSSCMRRRGGRHGNFYDDAYAAILQRGEWLKRLGKIHAQAGRVVAKERAAVV